jgi:hypothetical protein
MKCATQHHRVRRIGYVCALFTALLCKSAAAQDTAGVTRTYVGHNSPSPWSSLFYDFASGQYKAECVSGGVMVGVSADTSGVLNPHGIYCKSTETNPLYFDQSNPETSNERDESFSSADSADYGHHPVGGNADWASGYYKGECPVGSVATGIAQSANSSQSVDTLHCSKTIGQMCYNFGFWYQSNTTCHTVALPSGGNSYTDWDFGYYKVSCGAHEAVVGVSTDTTNHHPHSILCCGLSYTIC